MNPLQEVKHKISPPFLKFRKFLETQREKNSKAFDAFADGASLFIALVGSFAPVLFTNLAWLAFITFGLFIILLTLQWALLTNKAERNLNDYKNKILGQKEKDDAKLYTEAIEGMDKWEQLAEDIAGFSHSVADNVKKISQEITFPLSVSTNKRMYTFIQDAVSSLEKVLSNLYGIQIRASIKLAADDENCFKTYARGKNNINSRGGVWKVQKLNKRPLYISKNYAYDAIVNKELSFFAEGNLLNLKNRYKEEDKFYCEYPEYWKIFKASVVMPIRIPMYTTSDEKQVILGLLCVDTASVFSEWSRADLTDTIGYHVIADLADNLAFFIKAYKRI